MWQECPLRLAPTPSLPQMPLERTRSDFGDIMHKLKTTAVPALAAGLLLSASSVLAQEVRFNDIDRDADGVLTSAELRAVFGPRGDVILSNDRNGDGVVTRNELLAVGGSQDDDRRSFLGGSDDRDDDRRDDDWDDDRDDRRGADYND